MINLTIHTDGGARGNPGPAASSFVVQDSEEKEIISQSFYLGETTNNVAEYSGVLKALEWGVENIKNPKETSLHFLIDSLLIVKQLSGEYKIKNETLSILAKQIKLLENNFNKISYTHIPREKNKEADALVNVCLDQYSTGKIG